MRSWFLPRDLDVMQLLRQQAASVDAGVRVVRDWSVGGADLQGAVGRLHELAEGERELRRSLHLAVRDSFSTPLQPEDVLELAERLLEVLEESYSLVREAQLVGVPPDDALRDMTSGLATSSALALQAIELLPSPRAAAVADEVLEALGQVEHGYREGMVVLVGDTHARVLRMELYRRAEHVERALRRVARRVWYSVAKLE